MLNMEEINKEISRLENAKCSYSVCEKLAALYIVRDHLTLSTSPSVEIKKERKEELGL